jgi:uncharacterized protein (TIGR02147 family)
MDAPMEKSPVPIYAYTDYRAYLKDYYQHRKSVDRKFSHRYIMEKVGASSAGWFSDVIAGRISLTSTHLLRLAKLMDLRPSEEDYLENLVHYAMSASAEERDRFYRKILAARETKLEVVGADRFEFYTQWWHSAIRELLFFYDYRGDHQALAAKLNPPIKPQLAKKSIQLLEALGFIARNTQGQYKPTDTSLRKDAGAKTGALQDLLKTQSHLGTLALDRLTKEERDISALTLSLSQAGFEKARAEVKALRKKLLDLTEEDAHPEKVFQCNFQMFPVTQ